MDARFLQLLGRFVCWKREELSLSQSELAQQSSLPRKLVSEFESGSRAPSLGALLKLCRALGVSSSELLGTCSFAQHMRVPLSTAEVLQLPQVDANGAVNIPFNEVCTVDLLHRFNLTDREAEVLLRVAKGKTNREIAEALYVSVETVKSHMRRIFKKLSVTGRTAAVVKVFNEDGTRDRRQVPDRVLRS